MKEEVQSYLYSNSQTKFGFEVDPLTKPQKRMPNEKLNESNADVDSFSEFEKTEDDLDSESSIFSEFMESKAHNSGGNRISAKQIIDGNRFEDLDALYDRESSSIAWKSSWELKL